MSAISIPNLPALVSSPVASEVLQGLTAQPKTLSPWLFYDEVGSRLFEEITELPEYYVTRTERNILAQHADEIVAETEPQISLISPIKIKSKSLATDFHGSTTDKA